MEIHTTMEEIVACLQLDPSYVNAELSLSQCKQTSSCAENGTARASRRTPAMSFHSLTAHQRAVPTQTHGAAAKASLPPTW